MTDLVQVIVFGLPSNEGADLYGKIEDEIQKAISGVEDFEVKYKNVVCSFLADIRQIVSGKTIVLDFKTDNHGTMDGDWKDHAFMLVEKVIKKYYPIAKVKEGFDR